jgi:hypothetical protein
MMRKRPRMSHVLLVVGSFFLAIGAGVAWAGTYYIDYNAANDSANGMAKTTAWKRHPYMNGFSGSYTHAAGDQFVFKGGVTWPSTCFQMTIVAGGSPGSPDLYTVDQTWYTGGAWARPIFDGEYSALGTGNNIVSMNRLSNITFNNLEVKRLKCFANWSVGMFSLYACNNIQWTYCYLHGWSLDAGVATDDAHGAIIHTVSGGLSMTGMVVDHCEIENTAWTGVRQNGVAVRQVNTIRYSKLHDVSSAVLFCGDFYDNEVYNVNYPLGNQTFDVTYHTNVLYLDVWNGNAAITTPSNVYNNYFHDLAAGTPAIYPSTATDATFYVYNNVVYGATGTSMAVAIEPYGGAGDVITVYVFNNTFVFPSGTGNLVHCVDRGGNPRAKSVIAKNNHIIGTNVGVLGGVYAGSTLGNNLIQTVGVASAQGYSQTSRYSPTLASGSTVDAGVAAPFILPTDILGTSRPQGAAWDIGAYEWTAGSSAPLAPSGIRLK